MHQSRFRRLLAAVLAGDGNSQFAATLQKPVDPAKLASTVAAVVEQQPTA